MPNTVIKISRKSLSHNLAIFRHRLGKNVLLAPAVKANAYGHGLEIVSKLAIKYGADWLCVTSVQEALALRKVKITKPLMIIGPIAEEDLSLVLKTNSRVFAYSLPFAKKLAQIAKTGKTEVKIHLKIDSGMSRQGILPSELENFIKKVSQYPQLKIEGIATHFATSDGTKNNKIFLNQLAIFKQSAAQAENILKKKLIKHCANSAAMMLYDDAIMDMCRPGISLYGYYPSREIKKIWEKTNQPLWPVMTVATQISDIRKIAKGEGVSYGHTFRAIKPMTVALLPIGYADGWPRLLSNCGQVLIGGKIAPIVGRVCMNLTVVDISNTPKTKIGGEAIIIGRQKNWQITADDLAESAETINYEILTNWKESIKRICI